MAAKEAAAFRRVGLVSASSQYPPNTEYIKNKTSHKVYEGVADTRVMI
jgi:hypothetical protein